MQKLLSELDITISETEGIRDILGIVADCAAEGPNSLDNYTMGFYQLHSMICENVKKLGEIKDSLFEELRKVAKQYEK